MTQTNSTLYTIIPQVDDPYSQVIAEFFAREFPNSLTNATSLLELLTQAFVSTSQIRYGPAPKPESLVEIRKVISRAIELGRPIPVLIPWGGRKAIVERGIDIAEVVALKQLECLQSRVTRHYPAGIDARIRVEDTGALYLYQEDGYRGENAVEDYSSAFQRLVRILNLPFINPIRESSLMATDEYFGLSDQIAQPMFDYLVESAQVGFQPRARHGSGSRISAGRGRSRLSNANTTSGAIEPILRAYLSLRPLGCLPRISLAPWPATS